MALAATISAGGEGYTVGDVLTPITLGNDNLGSGMRLSVGTISGNNQLLLDGVQGNFNAIGGNDLEYVNFRPEQPLNSMVEVLSRRTQSSFLMRRMKVFT